MNNVNEVDECFNKNNHPQKETMLAICRVIMDSDERMSECIKWTGPTYTYKGDFASLQFNTRKFANKMVHKGAQIPGEHPYLEGDARLVRTTKFSDISDVLE